MKRLKQSYWIYSGFFTGLQKVSVPLFSIVYTIVLAHRLPKVEMGEWSIFLILSSFVEMTRAGLIRSAVIRFLNEKRPEQEEKDIISAALIWNIIITLLVGLLLVIFHRSIASVFNSVYFSKIVWIFFGGLILLIPFSHIEWILIARLRFNTVFWGYFIRQFFVLISILIYNQFTDQLSLPVLAILYSSGILFGLFYFLIKTKGYLILHFSQQVWRWAKDIFSFGKYVFGTVGSMLFFRSSPPFLITSYYGTSLLGGQNIADRITNFLDMPSQIMADLVFPKNALLSTEGDAGRIKYLYEKAVGVALAVGIIPLLVLIIFSKEVLFVFGGAKYFDTIPYLRVVLLSTLFMPFLKQCGITLDSTGKPRLNFFMNLGVAVVNMILCFLLIPPYGLIGAAIAVVSSMAIAMVFIQYILRKHYGINVWNSFRYGFEFYVTAWGFVKKYIFKRKQTSANE
ncbi:MAG: polysaccharide biosynthesis C-terminal domain-containing protein [Chitinophagaceae bacterium]|nr:polysaccharide biosynthesis C-terminal domain-containing protein [Chitinophagaceae bacterium]